MSLPVEGMTCASCVARVQRAERMVRPIVALVFLLAGLNDTLVYWFL